MKLLLIEDESDKSENICSYINNEFAEIVLDLAKSYTTAIKKIYEKCYDLILLDMSLPYSEFGEANFENNEFETFGGIDILDELKRSDYKTDVVVITAFDILGENDNTISLLQLSEKLKKKYPEIYKDSIHYNSSSIEWKQKLKEFIVNQK